MFKFSLKILAGILLLVGIALVNRYQDPNYTYFGSGDEHAILASLKSGKTFQISNPPNLRILRKIQMENHKTQTGLAIIGGSTSLDVNSSLFDSLSIVNFSIIDADMRDYLGLYYTYSEKSEKSKHLLFDISAYSFLEDMNSVPRWISLRKEYRKGLNMIHDYSIWQDLNARAIELRALLSIPSFRKSMEGMWNNTSEHGERELPIYFRPDGSWNRMTVADSLNKRKAHPDSFDPNYDPSGQVNWAKLEQFGKMIAHAKLRHEQVWVLLSPYAPSFYHDAIKNEHIILLEKELREMAKEESVQIIGSFDPSRLNLSEEDFMDQIHWHIKTIEKYFQSISFESQLKEYVSEN